MPYKCDMCDKGFTQYAHLSLKKNSKTLLTKIKCKIV